MVREVAALDFSEPDGAVEFLDEFDQAVGILLPAGGFGKLLPILRLCLHSVASFVLDTPGK